MNKIEPRGHWTDAHIMWEYVVGNYFSVTQYIALNKAGDVLGTYMQYKEAKQSLEKYAHILNSQYQGDN